MTPIALQFDNVSKRYENNSNYSVEPTSLNINQDDFITIVGRSGSGKTTLLKMINRVIEPTEGSIKIFGESILDKNLVELRKNIGYAIQHVGLFPHMNIFENISILLKANKVAKRTILERVEYLMQLVSLDTSLINRYPKDLSGGEKQRVGIARALSLDPQILLMDEPFSSIDPITRSKLQEDFLDIHKRLKKTIIFVTHDIQEALTLGGKIIVMDKGKVQQFDTPFNIITKPSNTFVKQLLQTENTLQLLSFTKVKDLMINIGENKNIPTVYEEQLLSEVLPKFWRESTPVMKVLNSINEVVGEITLKSIEQYAVKK